MTTHAREVNGYLVTLTIDDDSPSCTALYVEQLLGGEPVTLAALRTVPVATLVREAVADRGEPIPAGPPSDELVALVYRQAIDLGCPPTKAVRDHFGLSPASAGRRVAAARRSGAL